MRRTTSWRRLRGGTADHFVLAVDFDFTGRPEANFGNLAATADLDHEVWQTVVPPESARELLPAADYLDFWADLPAGAAGHVDAIMGYCVGCLFLPALADRVELLQGRRPDLLLFDPQPSTVAGMYQDFRKIVAPMNVLSEQEKHRVLLAGAQICDSGGDFLVVATAMADLYRDAVDTASARLSLDDAVRVDLFEMFHSYAAYLTAASQLPAEDGRRTGTALTSLGVRSGAGSTGTELRFPVRAPDLLRDPRVADTVFDLLETGDAGH
jgi:hypothetical protein